MMLSLADFLLPPRHDFRHCFSHYFHVRFATPLSAMATYEYRHSAPLMPREAASLPATLRYDAIRHCCCRRLRRYFAISA